LNTLNKESSEKEFLVADKAELSKEEELELKAK
jgi:hypothetical protein